MKIRIKYFEGSTKLEKIAKGNWIDVYSSKDVFIRHGQSTTIPLGFALELPRGWEGHIVPRSSTWKTWGLIQTNHIGIVDDSYIGNNDEWSIPVYCLKGKMSLYKYSVFPKGSWVRKGDKIGQFRIVEVMPSIDFEEVSYLDNPDRGGYGTTGRSK